MLKALRDKKAALVTQGKDLLALAAKNEGGLLSEAQQAEHDAIMSQIQAVNRNIASAEALQEEERTMTPVAARVTESTDADRRASNPRIEGGHDNASDRPFTSFGEQLLAIKAAASPDRVIDPRLSVGAIAGSSERVASDGGFLVQQDFSNEILRRVYETGEISTRVRRIPISAGSNGLKMNGIKETSRATGSRFGGITMGWEGEGDTTTASKPKFRQIDMRLKKLIGLAYATDELLEDSVAFNAVMTEAFADETTFLVEDAILRGNGAGQPKGVLNSAALVTVSKETGQAADTIVYDNVLNMWSRCWARSRKNAVWLINQDCEPQLAKMNLAVGTGGVPVYLPANGASESPFSTLFGRPVIPVEQASALGDVGDIGLYDFSQYLMIDKGAPKQSVSIHVRFIYDESAFRITYRVDGQPLWEAPLTPYKGANTLSPFVTLAAR